MQRSNIPSYEVFSAAASTRVGVVFTGSSFNLSVLIGERGAESQTRYFARPDGTQRLYDVFAFNEEGRIDFSTVVGFVIVTGAQMHLKVVDASGAKQTYELRATRRGRQPSRPPREDRSYLLAH